MVAEEVYKDLLEDGRRMLLENNDLESILFFLRQHGCTIVDSIRMVAELQGIGLGEAKLLVHNSETWSDVRLRNEAVQEALLREFDNPTQGQVA
jgi:ribosomal protein L7/L12